jgi:hypothetical protein
METTIPFSGFYNSIHSDELDAALESNFSDSNGSPIPSLVERAFPLIDWESCHVDYARKYTECFAEKFNLKTLKFKMLCSPKYYNFETDRIICHIDKLEVRRILSKVDKITFTQLIKDKFTSCSGFISHYPNDLTEWPDALSTWDHNQIGTLIEAYVRGKYPRDFDSYAEYELMNNAHEHAYLAIQNNSINKIDKLYKIINYLHEREERQWKHV